jgi:HlyD family secretion protein
VDAKAAEAKTRRQAEIPTPSAPGDVDFNAELERLRGSGDGRDDEPRGRQRRWTNWLPIALVLAAGAYFLPPLLQPAPLEVRLATVVLREVGLPPVVLSATGYVVPEREITVASSTQGMLTEMPVEENQRVRAGDLIARVENRGEQANLELAEAERDEAARELRLVRELFDRGVRSRNEVDRAQSAFVRARARLALARTALDDTVLRAPFDGTVVRKFRAAGEMVTLGVTAEGASGTAIVTLADLDPLHVALEINEAEIGKLGVGMVALLTPEGRPDRRYVSDLVEISARADRSKGVVPARVRIRDGDAALLPNMTVSVRFLREPPREQIRVQPSVPRSALLRRDGRSYVFVVEDGLVQEVPVVLAGGRYRAPSAEGAAFSATADVAAGPREDFVALLDGPREGAYVVDSPPAALATGTAVRAAQ